LRSDASKYSTQCYGIVSVILRPYSYTLVGVESSFDLVKTDFGDYGEVGKGWTAEDAERVY
jgi:hypothetical protein